MDNRDTRHTRRRKKRRKKTLNPGKIILILCVLAIVIAGSIILYGHYAPTTERMPLEEYYVITASDEAAVILNGEYVPEEEVHDINAIVSANAAYISLEYLKDYIDDGYVYDSDAGIMRYVTDKDLVSVSLGSNQYGIGREVFDHSAAILISTYDTVFVNMDFVTKFSDIGYVLASEPSRLVIETAGTEKMVATLQRDTAIRRFGGPKSLILADGIKDEEVWVKENYGRWSRIVTREGVIGCVENGTLGIPATVFVEARLPEREFTHNLMDEKVIMAWHQVTNVSANDNLANILANTSGINVLSPTWYRIADNDGNVSSIASQGYVNFCHSRGIKVWALVSNFEVQGVDSTLVLNRVVSRDNLVNQLIARALADNVDGLNIDFEALSINAKDGFIEFIKEISLLCKANNLVLSVVNYKPEAHTRFYNRTVQSQYADYVMVMGYDEYHNDSTEAGSNASLPFVQEGVKDTLEEVPQEQLILGLPFYTRIWSTDAAGVTNRSVSMNEANRQVTQSGAEKVWLNTEQQYYAEYEWEGRSCRVWLEDEQSMAAKLAVAADNNLSGVAFWRLGFEPASIWPIITGYIK